MSTTAIPPTAPKARRRIWTTIRRRVVLLLLCLLLTLLVPSDGYLGSARADLILNSSIAGHGFQLAAWEVAALSQKAADLVARPGADLSPQEQHDLAVHFFDDVGRVDDLAAKIERIYADPQQADPASAAASLQAELDALRAEQERRRPAVERILERQAATVLEEAGLTTRGVFFPPVRFQFTESPFYLIVSPRTRIAVEHGIYLDPTLALAQIEGIENRTAERLGMSALIEGTGGFSSYPTMIIEYPGMDWVLSTISHEWGHLYLFFRPLGQRYFDNGDMRTLNETTVSILGDEIGQKLLGRYYPERLAPAAWPRPQALRADWWDRQQARPEFDYGEFMRTTRLQVDKLLAEGSVDEAEAFMEAQRQILVDHGYAIRKLNQAFFAFHGSYAVGPSATDPIGGKLRALRERSGSLAEFMAKVARITSATELDAALAR
ncbi:MAG: hypothetical protein NT169_28015 [Chloroflexi bacterium]|nr:hypothetical protein [Chloroflexota bacterium]